MLRRRLVSIVLGFAIGCTPFTQAPAAADGCVGQSWGVACGVGVDGSAGSPGAAGGSNAGVQVTCVTQELPPREVPCATPDWGTWSNARACYLRLASPQPAQNDPVWKGNTTGAIYTCSSAGIWNGPGSYNLWLSTAPGVAPDPRVLAQQAVTQMRLRGVTVGMAPNATPGAVGLVGLPIWLWVVAPDANTWGPVTKTASAGGYSVSATGKVTQVVWSMGDGGAVACTSPGTPYSDSFGLTPSPDCGYRYAKQGTYTVTATSYWTITWSGVGQSGVIRQTYSSSVMVTIGELQVVVKG
jgi:hypothetical protein